MAYCLPCPYTNNSINMLPEQLCRHIDFEVKLLG